MKHILIYLIKLYQKLPLGTHGLCKFYPTCSNYGIEAIETHGAFKGTYLTIKRIFKCNPFAKGGFDPVPPKIKENKKMKKNKLLLIPILLLLITGCFKRDTMEDINIATTVYPLEYVTNFLYGENSVINSIYPDGIDIYTYDLLDKQIKDYSKQDLFIYTGVSNDRDIALTLLNENNNILIIDATYGMEITNGIEELWLNPSNLLMISQNIKNGLEEYITSKFLKQEIEEAYSELKIKLSELDADLKVLAENATSKTIVVANNSLKFLEKYGFNIISLEDASLLDKSTNDVTNLINNGSIKYIYQLEYSGENEVITNLKNTTNVEVISLKSIANITDEERDNRDDYIKLMTDIIELLKKETYK